MAGVGPRGPGRDGYSHEAAYYRGHEGLLAEVLPFVREGVSRGERVKVVLAPASLDVLADSLGDDATAVDLVDMGDVASNPARVIAEWRTFVAESDEGVPVRGVGEPVWPGRRDVEVEEALMNEALFDLAFEGRGTMNMLCPYDVDALPADVLARARRIHPPRRTPGRPDAAWEAGRAAIGSPLRPPPPDAQAWEFGAGDLTDLRHLVERLARLAGAGRAVDDLMLAAHELATNSVVHAGGWGTLRSWTEPDALVLEVSDAGVIKDPLVGREVLDDLAESGRGVWLANQLCDLVQVRSSAHGTVVRLFTWL